MFSFFNSKEKKLREIGYSSVVDEIKEKRKKGEISKEEYNKQIDEWYLKNQKAIEQGKHVEVSARQSFDESEVLPPLNLENIALEVFDIDYVESLLLFEYKEHQKIDQKIIRELINYHKKNNSTITKEIQSLTDYTEKELLEIATSRTHDITKVVAALQALQK